MLLYQVSRRGQLAVRTHVADEAGEGADAASGKKGGKHAKQKPGPKILKRPAANSLASPKRAKHDEEEEAICL